MRVSDLRRAYHCKRWQRLRLAIKNRDNWRCRLCKVVGGRLEVHHIVSPLHGGEMWDPDNLRTLCRVCHFETHRKQRKLSADNQARMDWIYRG